MQTQMNLPKADVQSIIDRIFQTRRISRTDQQMFLQAMLSKQFLTSREQEQVDRIFDGLRSGLVRVID